MNKTTIVFCTAPNEITARDLSVKILEKKLVACVTILPSAISVYFWENELKQTREVQMFLKTDTSRLKSLCEFLKTCHPYQTPELLALSVIYGEKEYLSWIKNILQ